MTLDPVLLLGALTTLLVGLGGKDAVLAWVASRTARTAKQEAAEETREEALARRVSDLETLVTHLQAQVLEFVQKCTRQEVLLGAAQDGRQNERQRREDLERAIWKVARPQAPDIYACAQELALERTTRLEPTNLPADPPKGTTP